MKQTAVVILNWNGQKHLEHYMPSVVSNTPSEVRIIVADNGSTDDSVRFLKEQYPSVEIIEFDKNYGFAEGYNRALRLVEAEYYILLNSDVEVSEGWTQPLIEMLQSDEKIAAVAPKLISDVERDKFEYAGAAGGFIDYLGYPLCRGRILSTIEQDKGQYDTAREVFWASGAAFCCRAEVFHSLGGFDGDFFAHMEEIDLCWRMQLAGYKVMSEPKSVVYHLGGGTLPNESPGKLYLNYRNNLAMLFKCAPTAQRISAAILRPLADSLSVVIYLLKRQPQLAKATLKAYRDFFAWHKELGRKRKAIRGARVAESKQIYKGSMVVRYMLGRHTFDNMI